MRQIYTYKIGIIILCFIIIISISQGVIAHSPSNMNLSYDSENQELLVTINHQVSNPDSHYIYNIIIKKNGLTYNNYEYSSQPTSSSFSYSYELNISAEDVIEITAQCNQGGSITRQITINDIDGTSDGSSTPGFELIIILSAIGLAIFWKLKH